MTRTTFVHEIFLIVFLDMSVLFYYFKLELDNHLSKNTQEKLVITFR